MATIRVRTGPNKGRLYDIQDTPLTVGREENQVIQILDQGVSRAHAEIFRLGEMCFIRDLNFTNGTFVNDVELSEESLRLQILKRLKRDVGQAGARHGEGG